VGAGRGRAFTLVELLVVIAIITTLLAILGPALTGVRRQATALLGMRNQRETANALNLFAADNDDRYPPSMATVGVEDNWTWSAPTQITGNKKRTPQVHRSVSAYLHDYLADAKTVACPSAPQKYTYLQESWDAGDDWDNPDTAPTSDPVGGTYCFYWNYLGFLREPRVLFRGPYGPAAGGTQSQLLISDYFGYGHWRTAEVLSSEAFSSCERLPGAEIVPEQQLQASWWAAPGDPNTAMPNIKLHAAYIDGHVETYSPADTVPMRVPLTAEGVPPFPDGGASKGLFYIPRSALP
jgi:prepilin-type N-terminal cleavage/methylation domain-containing protein